MTIPTFELTAEHVAKGITAFPDEIARAEDVIFHGTSCSAERDIEANGFRWLPAAGAQSDVANLVEIFDRLWWAGDSEGFGVLKVYATKDFKNGAEGSKSVFFSDNPIRPTLYATRLRSGGETAFAIRMCAQDLRYFAADAEFRRSELYRVYASLERPWVTLCPPDIRIQSPDLLTYSKLHRFWRWRQANVPGAHQAEPLQDDVELDPLVERAEQIAAPAFDAWRRHSHGVVYALRMTADQRRAMKTHAGELPVSGPVPAGRIVAKMIVPNDLERRILSTSYQHNRMKFRRNYLD